MPDEVRRRPFPPPWTIEDNGACFIVKDNNGKAGILSQNRISRTVAHDGRLHKYVVGVFELRDGIRCFRRRQGAKIGVRAALLELSMRRHVH